MIIIIILICININADKVYASEETDEINSNIEDYDFDEIDKKTEGIIDFKETVKSLANGDTDVVSGMFDGIWDYIFKEMSKNKSELVKLVLIGVISAFITNLSNVLKNSQISKMGFYVIYIMFITITLVSFDTVNKTAAELIEALSVFIEVLIPTFALSVGMSGHSVYATCFSELIIITIAIIDKLVISFLLPLINVYVIIKLVNNMMDDGYFTKFTELIKMLINGMVKGIMTVVLGADIIQAMVIPIVSNAKVAAVRKVINILPGGEIITGFEGIVNGASHVIKNAIGGAGLITIICICAIPVIKMIVFIIMYKMSAALLEPICDKRLVNSIDGVSEGAMFLYKTVINVIILFFITIALVCMTSGGKSV